MFLPLSVICSIACALGVPYQLAAQLWAPLQALPGTAMVLVAPVARMRRMASFAALTQFSVAMLKGSFTTPKMTFGLPLNTLARRDEKPPKAALGTPLEPITWPR